LALPKEEGEEPVSLHAKATSLGKRGCSLQKSPASFGDSREKCCEPRAPTCLSSPTPPPLFCSFLSHPPSRSPATHSRGVRDSSNWVNTSVHFFPMTEQLLASLPSHCTWASWPCPWPASPGFSCPSSILAVVSHWQSNWAKGTDQSEADTASSWGDRVVTRLVVCRREEMERTVVSWTGESSTCFSPTGGKERGGARCCFTGQIVVLVRIIYLLTIKGSKS